MPDCGKGTRKGCAATVRPGNEAESGAGVGERPLETEFTFVCAKRWVARGLSSNAFGRIEPGAGMGRQLGKGGLRRPRAGSAVKQV